MMKRNVDSKYSLPSFYVSDFFQMNTSGKCQNFKAKVRHTVLIIIRSKLMFGSIQKVKHNLLGVWNAMIQLFFIKLQQLSRKWGYLVKQCLKKNKLIRRISVNKG